MEIVDLLGIPRGVIGGLIVERGEPVRAGTYQERWRREIDLWSAITDGLRVAIQGMQPKRTVDRLPSWLVAAARNRLRDHRIYWFGNDFGVVRLLELVGLADFEPDDDYVMSMLTGLVAARSWDGSLFNDPVAWFRQDPELMERGYWRAYEIEGQGVISLRVGDAHGVGWRAATRKMIEEGLITRDQVIGACLAALDRDFSSAASQWFIRMLTDLDLTDDELAAMQPSLHRQLNHTAAAVVKNAIGWIQRLDRQGRLDDESTALALEAAVVAPTKITALAGLRLLDRIRIRTPSADVVTAARAGLGHRHPDVQRTAAQLLQAVGAATTLAANADLLDPSIQQDFGLQPAPTSTITNPASDSAAADNVQHPVPGPLMPWRPVTQRDLAERLAVLLERAQDPFELELVLDQLARTGKSDLLHPLAKRAQTVASANEYHRLEQQLARLVLSSCGTPAGPPTPQLPWAQFLTRRLNEVAEILNGGAPPRVLLATPTDPTGWLDPVAFVRRARHADLTASDPDLIAALLRLAPDTRDEALQLWTRTSPAVDPQIDHAIRHALGADPDASRTVADRALWVAASRARSAVEDDPLLIENGLTGAGQGRGLDATVSVAANPRWRPSERWEYDQWDLHVSYLHSCTPAAFTASSRDSWWTRTRPADVNQPTAVGNVTSGAALDTLGWIDTTWLAWHGLIWPADAEHYANVVIVPTYVSRQWTNPDRTTIDILTALRRHPGRIGPTAAAIVALAATGGTVETRIHAADTIVDLIGRHRVGTDDLAAALITTPPAAIPGRWTETLHHLAGAGHADTTIQLLTRVLPALPADRRGLHGLLDLLHQELVRTNTTIAEPRLRSYLAQITGSSKAARSARAILAL